MCFLPSAVQQLIATNGTLQQAITIPNLPPAFPPGADTIKKDNVIEPPGSYDDNVAACYASYANQTYGYTPVCLASSPQLKSLGALAPSMPGPAPSPCPPVICKARPYLDMSCTGFALNASGGPPLSLMVRADVHGGISGLQRFFLIDRNAIECCRACLMRSCTTTPRALMQ